VPHFIALIRRIFYIVNPVAGTRSKQPLKELIQQQSNKAGIFFEIRDAVKEGGYSFLEPLIQQQGITDIVIAGGDGTVNGVLGSLHQLNVKFGIIPCGSGNGLAFSAGISKNAKKALQTIFNGKSLATDAFYVNRQFACMLCGLGFDAQVAHDFAQHHTRGRGAYINKIMGNLLKAPVYAFTLTADNFTITTEAYFISIANSNQYGNNFTIAPQASLTDGFLDVIVAASQNKISLLLQTLKQVSGLNKVQHIEEINQAASVLYFRAKNLFITNLQNAPLHIDGEPVSSTTHVDIQIKEKAFQLIYP